MIIKITARVTLAAVLLLCGACITHGTRFSHPSDEDLSLGKTTLTEIRDRYGKPASARMSAAHGRAIQQLTYSYATAALLTRTVSSGAITFSFDGEVLVGYYSTRISSTAAPDDDEERLKRIRARETTEAQVIALLGPPDGRAIYPEAQAIGLTRLTYTYRVRKGEHSHIRLVVIIIDTDKTVKTLVSTSTEPK
jgi:hypothetical protein